MRIISLSFVAILLLVSNLAQADYRPFTFVYDTYPMVKGGWEYEQWVTYTGHKEVDSGFDQFTFRHEIEYGVADNFKLSLYLATWKYENSAETRGTQFDSSSIEGILYLMNPVTDPIGLGLYAEFGIGQHALEFEQKLLVQKDIGKWTFAYNLILETAIQGIADKAKDNEVQGVLEHTLGASYSLTPAWRLGAEAIIESVYADWSDYQGTSVYAGPNVSYQGGKHWWITFTPTFQLTNKAEEPDLNFRIIGGLQY